MEDVVRNGNINQHEYINIIEKRRVCKGNYISSGNANSYTTMVKNCANEMTWL